MGVFPFMAIFVSSKKGEQSNFLFSLLFFFGGGLGLVWFGLGNKILLGGLHLIKRFLQLPSSEWDNVTHH